MIIDFHTHAFPDALAARTIPMLAEKAHTVPYTDGTAAGLRAAITAAGVDLAIVLPVVTKPSQFDSITAFAETISGQPGLHSFGGIHPDDAEVDAHLDRVRDAGLGGIKIHPDYQGVFIDDERYIRIARAAVDRNLAVITHAGVDDGFPDCTHCPPERAARFIEAVCHGDPQRESRLIFAHGGGNRMFADVRQYLSGTRVYIDLSYIFAYASPEEITALIRAHGVDRTLFASDCPWGDPAEGLRFVRSLPLTDEEKSAILGENARTLLSAIGVTV